MSGYVNPGVPNVTDYYTFLTNQLGVTAVNLPSSSPWLTYALDQALDLVAQIVTTSQYDYTNIVYNCAAHVQIEITPDEPGLAFFTALRGPPPSGFNIYGPISGLISAASDNGTAQSNVVPEGMKRLTFEDLQFAKTVWGRRYLGYCQDYGSVWGIS